jgi:hypothetical protein
VFRRLNEHVRRLRRWRIQTLIDKSFKNEVVAVRRQGDKIIMIKSVFGDLVLNIISVYVPQVGLSDDVKR